MFNNRRGFHAPHLPFHFMLLEQLARQFFLSVLPTGVKFVVKFVFCVFILQQVIPSLTDWWAFSPAAVLQGEVWLLWTGSLVHADVQHVCHNMLAVCSFHTPLERKFGTLRYLELVLWSMLLTKLCYLSLALFQVWYYGSQAIWNQDVVGFSGVIFLLSVLECHLFPQFEREVHVPFFGNFKIKSQWYPWVLLILCEFIVPGSSFTGHLSGILAGVGVQMGWIRPWYVPANILQKMESYKALRFLTSDRYFTETPSFGSEPSFGNGTSRSNRRTSPPRQNRNDSEEGSEPSFGNGTSRSNRRTSPRQNRNDSEEEATTEEKFESPSAEDVRELRSRRYAKSDRVKKPKKKLPPPQLKKQYFTSEGRTLKNPAKKDERADSNDKEEEQVESLSPEELRALRRKRYQVKTTNKKVAAVPKTTSTNNGNPTNDSSRDDRKSASYRARVSAQWAEANATNRTTGFNPYQATNNGYYATGHD